MRQALETILTEFPSQVVASHALVVAQILAGETLEHDLFYHLAAETLASTKINQPHVHAHRVQRRR